MLLKSILIKGKPGKFTTLGCKIKLHIFTFLAALPLPYLSICVNAMLKILDDEDMRRRLRFSTYNREIRLTTFLTSAGLALVPGWNIVQLDLAQVTSLSH